ncbi:MAG: thioredoxin family protein [Bacteroidia bacterium]|nr:thioredoxin family protein [Bacteroidia bacterium]MBT8268177.1 thioredoxin family protein [Bacteroidia bacterium]NNK71257.1 thioredoxin fold domain-containing protein [Flavobacteriaceae bacterium]NNL79539.1 thioredoxin fold domain-containing protein [Flavobacteriaceae bacterium]
MVQKLILGFFVLISNMVIGQILDPVEWSFKVVDQGNNEYDLVFIAEMEEKWALYSQFVDEGGPIPTSFEFEENVDLERIGGVLELEENKETKNDPIFDMVVSKFYEKATFVQRVRLAGNDMTIKGFLTFQACDDEKCLMPTDVPFEFSYKNGVLEVGEADLGDESVVDYEDVNLQLYGLSPEDIQPSVDQCETQVTSLSSDVKSSKSLWNIFGLGFLGGLLALLTPCVFPMIPLTVSFFTKKNDADKSTGFSKAILYGVFILLVYLILSVPFHLLDSVNPDILNEISTNVALNIIFFLIFLFFAFSFFGYYELTLPSSWTAKTTKGESIGGIMGVFFMALTLAIVSFSCTGPILGSLLAGSLTTDGGAWQLTAGMGGFGVALGLPFALFAAFPQWLNSLPKSGGWLNTVKVVLGFLELALAFKFLSNADLVKHWGILKIEVFLGIWILIFAGLALYILGKIKFPHDSPIRKLSFLRVSTGVLVAAFTVYLLSGFRMNDETGTYKSLTLLSGLAPPVGYSWLHPNECPNDLDCFKDLKSGIAYAEKVNKPIMLDFTGYACVNCRKMEEHVWPDETIKRYLKEDFVLISLYVDDKEILPENEQKTVKRVNGGTRQLENYGHKWANFQTQFFQANSQPFYVLLSPDGKQILNDPVGYTPDEKDYASFLECGLEIFRQKEKSSPLNFSVN